MEHNILLISAGIVHPSLAARYWFRRALPSDGFRYARHASLDNLQTLSTRQYSAIVCYFHHKKIDQKTLDNLTAYIHNGGGIFAVHSASASFKEETRYHDLIGGRFDRHGPIEAFEVSPAMDADSIFPNLSPFTVRDELYVHVYEPDVSVHFTTPVDGQPEPVVWTKQAGRGRVCYLSLGHLGDTFRVPQVKRILHAGLAWLCEPAQAEAG